MAPARGPSSIPGRLERRQRSPAWCRPAPCPAIRSKKYAGLQTRHRAVRWPEPSGRQRKDFRSRCASGALDIPAPRGRGALERSGPAPDRSREFLVHHALPDPFRRERDRAQQHSSRFAAVEAGQSWDRAESKLARPAIARRVEVVAAISRQKKRTPPKRAVLSPSKEG
jgi:hypothetical protein